MGAALLRVNKLQDKWRTKLTLALQDQDKSRNIGNSTTMKHRLKRWAEKYAMFLLPFVTVLREGLEAVVYIGGVSLGYPATAFPLAVVCGLLAGSFIGYLIYRYGSALNVSPVSADCLQWWPGPVPSHLPRGLNLLLVSRRCWPVL